MPENNWTELTTDYDCDEASQMFEITDLEPAIQYNIQLVACFKAAHDEEVCSEHSTNRDEWAIPAGRLEFMFLQHMLLW